MTISEISKKYCIPEDTLRYYEKVGVIPPVTRTAGGIRDYSDEDCNWVEFAKCMRGAGLTVDAIVEYRRLFDEGDSTIAARLKLLSDQREILIAQQQQIAETLERLNHKISRYEVAVKTGVLTWK